MWWIRYSVISWEQRGQRRDCSAYEHISIFKFVREIDKFRLTSPNEDALKTKFVCAGWYDCTIDKVLETYTTMVSLDQFYSVINGILGNRRG